VVDDTAEGNLFRVPREKDLKRHLENMTDAKGEEEDDTDYQMVEKPSMFEFGGDEDYQLKQAINYLEGRDVERNQLDKSEKAEKKTLIKQSATDGIERYRVTPDGIERIQDE